MGPPSPGVGSSCPQTFQGDLPNGQFGSRQRPAVTHDSGPDGPGLPERSVVAVATALLGLVDPAAGAVGTGMTPAAETLAHRLRHGAQRHRTANLAHVLDAAARQTNLTAEELLDLGLTDPGRFELLVRVVRAAQDCSRRQKRLALARALATSALTNDTAVVDEELLFVDILDRIDAPHLRLLAVLASSRAGTGQLKGHELHDGWTLAELRARDPGLAQPLPILLATVTSAGLVEAERGTWRAVQAELYYSLTSIGRRFLTLVATDNDGSN
jgi:hypothetical protein